MAHRKELSEVDPAWAWSAYEPDAGRPWTRQLAAHLHRRAGFSASTADLDAAEKAGPASTVDRLCTPPKPAEQADFIKTVSMLASRTVAAGNPQQLPAWWLFR